MPVYYRFATNIQWYIYTCIPNYRPRGGVDVEKWRQKSGGGRRRRGDQGCSHALIPQMRNAIAPSLDTTFMF
jgi:hypothetical protein